MKFFRTLGADFVKLGPDQGRTLVVWQKLAKSFLIHARPFEVGGGGEVVKRVRIYCALCAFSSVRFQAKIFTVKQPGPPWAS